MKSQDQMDLTPDNFESLLQIRIWDETAKVPGKRTRTFGSYAPLLEGLIDTKSRRGIAMSTPT